MGLTWLHISDFHVRSGDPYDRDVVLRALVKSVAYYRSQGRAPDVIFATGDVAQSGKAAEYQLAEKFFDDLLTATGLDKRRLFIIPGNHDVDRDMGVGLARTLDSRERADTYFRPGLPKPHLTQKMGAFLDWHNRYFAGIRQAPTDSTCGPVESLEINGRRLGILPINSALFCEGDDDHAKLWIGRRCLDATLEDLKKLKTEFNVVLVHHPLEWLDPLEGSNIQASLEGSAQILLRGHLHETRIESVVSPEGQSLRCAAGAAYQSRKWPNRALYGTLDGNRLTIFPIRYEDAPSEIWTTDPSVFPREDKHQKSFLIGGFLEQGKEAHRKEPAPVRFRSNVPIRNKPFVGRDELLVKIAGMLGATVQVVIVHGQPGVGKSELAREYGRNNVDRYGGGTFWVDASTDAVAINFAHVGKTVLDLDFPPDLPLIEQGEKTFYTVGVGSALLIYDNVISFERIAPWLPSIGMRCHVVITTLLDSATSDWPCIEVEPLSRELSLELVKQLTGDQVPPRFQEAIADYAGGLPVQIVPDATTLAYEQRRGRVKAGPSTVARQAGESFKAAYDRLEQSARLLLHCASILNPQRIPAKELNLHLRNGVSWSEADVERTLDTCLDLHLLDGVPDPNMHQLFAKFLLATKPAADDQAALKQIRSAQAKRFVGLAKALATNPADTETASALLSYPLAPETWSTLGEQLSRHEWESIGRALYEIGRFAEARPWFELAVSEQEKAGSINHAQLSYSLHCVGYCLWGLGRFAEAQKWVERAVEEAEKGDAQGRVNHVSLGSSLYQVGANLSSTQQFAEARPWYERAVAEHEKGDALGRIDHTGLGHSLTQVGRCLSRAAQFAEARPWFERAVREYEGGDELGRIDYQSLGIALNWVGHCLVQTRQFAEARSWFDKAVAAQQRGDIFGRIDYEELGRISHQVGGCLVKMGQHADALPQFERAVAEKEKGDIYGRVDRQSLADSLRNGAACLRNLRQTERAEEWDRRAASLSS